jgi:transcriptional regulator with XRE-family HTH domain
MIRLIFLDVKTNCKIFFVVCIAFFSFRVIIALPKGGDLLEETKKIFADNLRKLLEIKKISQAAFADKIGVAKQTVSCWCRGVAFPNNDTLEKIGAFFGVDPATLLSFLETDRRMPAHLLAYMRALNSDGLRKLEERAEELLEIERYKRK